MNGHSARNARIGSIADARRAGIIAAATAAIVSIVIAAARTSSATSGRTRNGISLG
jgi:hypothetical protein